MNHQNVTALEIARRGTEIYERLYRRDYESKWRGRFVAIDIASEKAFVADYSEEAMAKARKSSPRGLFYLIRIGSRSAFKSSRRAHASRRETLEAVVQFMRDAPVGQPDPIPDDSADKGTS
jgi:hypothetical protein